MNPETYKAQAARLAEHLAVTHGIKLKHHAVLNAIAAIHGARNWNTLQAAPAGSACETSRETTADLLAAWLRPTATNAVLQTRQVEQHRYFAALVESDGPTHQLSNARIPGGLLSVTPGQQLCPVNIHQPEGSSVVITGGGGSGKTVLLQQLMCDTLARNGTVHALSYGHDHFTLSHVLQAPHIDFELGSPKGLNPFGGQPFSNADKARVSLVADFVLGLMQAAVSSAASGDGPQCEDDARELVRKAVSQEWLTNGVNASVKTVYRELVSSSNMTLCQGATLVLDTWAALGPWLESVDGATLSAFDQPFAVFEVIDLRDQPLVMHAVSMLVGLHSANAWRRVSRAAPKLFVVEFATYCMRGRTPGAFWSTLQGQFHRMGGWLRADGAELCAVGALCSSQ
jgi:hypothetical protein